MTLIQAKQISAPLGTTVAVTDGQALTGTEAGELFAGKDGSGNAQFLATETDGRLKISGTVTSTSPTDTVVTGAITAFNHTVDSGALNSPGSVTLSVTGTFSATLAIEASWDGGSTYVSWIAKSLSAGTMSSTLSVGGPVQVPSAGLTNVRIRCSAYTSGTANVRLVVQAAPTGVSVISPLPAGSSTIGAVTISGTPSVTSSTLALDATLTAGNQVAQIKSGAKGSSSSALVTSTASGANHQPLDVAIFDAIGNQITSFGGGTEYTVAEPTTGTAQGGVAFGLESGNNAYPIAVDSSGRQIVNVNGTVPVSGTFWQTTQPVSGTIAVSNSFALDATLTAGSQKAIVRGGAKGSTVASDVTSTASGANHQAIDVAIYDASGNQITSFGGGTQYNDGAARGSATGTLMLGDDGTNVQSLSCDTSGQLKVAGFVSITQTVNASGNWLNLTLNGQSSFALQGGGTASLTCDVQGSVDNSNWVTLNVWQVNSSGYASKQGSNIGVAGSTIFRGDCAGLKAIRIQLGSAPSVNGSVTLGASACTFSPVLGTIQEAAVPIGQVTQGAGNGSAANSWFTKISDGTNGPAAVKAASTAPVATDPALVVSLSPNKPGRSTCTNSNITAATSSTTILSSNTGRLGATFWNDSTSVCYLKFGSTASSTSCNVKLIADAYYELPTLADGPYTGIITAIWVSANGALRVGEVTV